MLDQEERLVEIHSLLLDLPPLEAPAALEAWQLGVSLEVVTIPVIDGTTGSKTQITASDRTRLFPRPRLALGLPVSRTFRAFVGLSYIPPVQIREVATNALAGEAGFAWVPGVFRAGLRVHGTVASSTAPVTDPATRDTLETQEWGADLSAGGRFAPSPRVALEPYAGGGFVALHGRFRVESDGNVITSDYAGPSWHAGVRATFGGRWELVTEVDGYPDRLVHTEFRLGYVFGL
jgi:hypothetical protein